MKAMLSQPMAGKTEEEIIKTREKAIKALEDKGYKIVNTLFTDEWYSQEKMNVELCRFRFASWQNPLKICPCAMLRTFARAGRMPEGAGSNMKQRSHMD